MPSGNASLEALGELLRDPARRGPFLVDTLGRLLWHDAERQPLLVILRQSEATDAESREILTQVFGGLGRSRAVLVGLQAEASGVVFVKDDPERTLGGEDPWAQSADQTWARLKQLVGEGGGADRTLMLDPGGKGAPAMVGRFLGLPCEVLAVGPLDELGTEELARRVLAPVEELPDALVSMLVASAGGIPARVEALVDALASHRVLEPIGEGERWRVRLERLSGGELPEELEALSVARLRALPSKHREILELASVVGPRFSVSELLALVRLVEEGLEPFAEQRTEPRVRRVLLESQGWDLIEYDAARGKKGDEGFAFRLEQERELLLKAVPAQEQARLHRVLACLGERGATRAEEVAAHWELGGDPRRAALVRLRAGMELAQAQELLEAARFLEAALAGLSVEEGEPVLDAQAALARCWRILGEGQRAEAVCAALARDAYVLGSAYHGAKAFLIRARVARKRGELEEAGGLLQRALALIEPDGSQRGLGARAELLDEMAIHRWSHGVHADEALELAEQARAIHESLGDHARTAQTLIFMARVLWSRGRPEEALRCYDEIERMARQGGGLKQWLARARNGRGVMALERGDVETARALWEEVLELSWEIGDRELRAMVMGNLGEVLLECGQGARARELLEGAVSLARSVGEYRLSAEALRHLPRLALMEGDTGRELALGQEALAEARRSGVRLKIGQALRTLGEVLSYQGRWSGSAEVDRLREAERCFGESAALLEAMGAQTDLRDTLASYEALLGRLGRGGEQAEVRRRLREIAAAP
jgi:tetratricopeptide (TPR) repeat protein